MKPFFSMVYYGCLQVVRARVAALFFAGGLVLVAFSVLLEEIAAGQNGRAIVALGLAGISLVTSVLAGVLPLILIRGQLDSRQAYILLTRPVGRPMFVVAYFIVTALVVVTGVFVFSLVLGGLSVFYEGEPFTTVVAAGVFGSLGAILLAAVSTLASVTTTSMTSVVIVGLFFILGRLAPELAALAHRGGQYSVVLDVLSRFLPDLGRFRWLELAGSGDNAPAAALYCFCYVAGLLLIAALSFQSKDLH